MIAQANAMIRQHSTPTARRWLACGLGATWLVAGNASAQIVTDGSVGPAAQRLAGPSYVIPESIGRLAGSNLMHSFQTFRINPGERATFTTTTPTIANVIGRVTGGEASAISGLLRLTAIAGTPAFYLINPAGITFGAGARIDVPGAFHASTADYLKFADGSALHADPAKSSSFSTASPAAFGFVGNARSTLALTPGAVLGTAAGRPISLVAGDILIDNAGIFSDGGEVRVAALGKRAQEVFLSAQPIDADGIFELRDGGWISTSTFTSSNAGTIRIRAGEVLIDGRYNPTGTGLYSTASDGTGDAGSVDITASRRTAVVNGGIVAAYTESIGNAGRITIASPDMRLDDAAIDASSYGTGHGGSIDVVGQRISLSRGGQIWASAQSRGPAGSVDLVAGESIDIAGRDNSRNRSAIIVQTLGQAAAGRVNLDAPQITIRDDGLVSGFALGGSLAATAGHINVTTGDLTLENGGKISVEGHDSMGQGSVLVNASGRLRILGKGEEPDPSPGSDTVSTGILGHATDIRINAREISLGESGAIRSESWWQDVPGRIDIRSERLDLDSGGHISGNAVGHSGTPGVGAPIVIHASESIRVAGSRNGRDSTIASGARSSGGAGSIDIVTPWLHVVDHGVINTSTGRFGTAGAGRIDIDVDRLELIDDGRLASIEWGQTASGGNISVRAGRSIVLDGGNILAWGANEAAAGRITLSAPQIGLHRGLITTNNEEFARSGGVQIDAGELRLTDGSRIQSSSTSAFKAGDITLRASGSIVVENSAITTTSENAGGGDIRIEGLNRPADLAALVLRNALLTTSVNGLAGNGGDISVRAGALAFDTGFIQANTAARGAAGGNIFIDVPNLLASGNNLRVGGNVQNSFRSNVFADNIIQAAAPDGVNGEINISAPALDISGNLAALATPVLDAGSLGRNPCQTTSGSSLSWVGRGGLPASAREPLRVEPAATIGAAANVSRPTPIRLAALHGDCR